MKAALLISLGIMVCGACATVDQIDAARTQNRERLLNLRVGMSRAEALDAMGTTAIEVNDEGARRRINNPYRTEMYRHNETTFELVHYYTDVKQRDGAITDDELTPLVFRDGILDGWGWSYWRDLISRYEIRVR